MTTSNSATRNYLSACRLYQRVETNDLIVSRLSERHLLVLEKTRAFESRTLVLGLLDSSRRHVTKVIRLYVDDQRQKAFTDKPDDIMAKNLKDRIEIKGNDNRDIIEAYRIAQARVKKTGFQENVKSLNADPGLRQETAFLSSLIGKDLGALSAVIPEICDRIKEPGKKEAAIRLLISRFSQSQPTARINDLKDKAAFFANLAVGDVIVSNNDGEILKAVVTRKTNDNRFSITRPNLQPSMEPTHRNFRFDPQRKEIVAYNGNIRAYFQFFHGDLWMEKGAGKEMMETWLNFKKKTAEHTQLYQDFPFAQIQASLPEETGVILGLRTIASKKEKALFAAEILVRQDRDKRRIAALIEALITTRISRQSEFKMEKWRQYRSSFPLLPDIAPKFPFEKIARKISLPVELACSLKGNRPLKLKALSLAEIVADLDSREEIATVLYAFICHKDPFKGSSKFQFMPSN